MSTDCIYKEFAVRVPATTAGQSEDQFLLVSLVGSSNCYVGSRRARDWSVTFAGTHEMQIANAINAGSSLAGRMLVFGNFGQSGRIQPQEYVRKVRRMLSKAVDLTDEAVLFCGSTSLMLQPKTHKTMNEALKAVFEMAREMSEKHARYSGYEFIKVLGNAYD